MRHFEEEKSQHNTQPSVGSFEVETPLKSSRPFGDILSSIADFEMTHRKTIDPLQLSSQGSEVTNPVI